MCEDGRQELKWERVDGCFDEHLERFVCKKEDDTWEEVSLFSDVIILLAYFSSPG